LTLLSAKKKNKKF